MIWMIFLSQPLAKRTGWSDNFFFGIGCNVNSDVVAFQGDICYAAGKSSIVVNFVKSDTGEC